MTELELALIIGKFQLSLPLYNSEKRQLFILANLNLISFGEADTINENTIKVREDVRRDLFPHRGDSSFINYLIDNPDNYNILKTGLDNIYPKGHWDSVLNYAIKEREYIIQFKNKKK
jgi:hypothetical protein